MSHLSSKTGSARSNCLLYYIGHTWCWLQKNQKWVAYMVTAYRLWICWHASTGLQHQRFILFPPPTTRWPSGSPGPTLSRLTHQVCPRRILLSGNFRNVLHHRPHGTHRHRPPPDQWPLPRRPGGSGHQQTTLLLHHNDIILENTAIVLNVAVPLVANHQI